jgi:hypothetical protein
MKDTLELIKKYGATAVLVAWLFHTNMRVASLEAKLYKCLEAQSYDEQIKRLSECILPEQIKLKDETKSS